MRKIKVSLILLASFCLAWATQDDPLLEKIETITAEECQAHVNILASPEYGGRGTPSPGLELAGEYVEAQLAALGLEPAGEDGSFRLPWDLRSLNAGKSSFSWTRKKEVVELDSTKDFSPVLGSKQLAAGGDPVFAGFAIDAKNERWQDLKKVKNKVVFAFTRTLGADNPKRKTFKGTKADQYGSFAAKVRAAAKAGASALILVPDPGAYPDAEIALPGMMPVPLAGRMNIKQLERMSSWPSIPVLTCSRATASAIFDTSIDDYYTSLEKRRKPKMLKAPRGTEVAVNVAWSIAEHEYWNLGAWIRGSEQDGEAVVLGTHLDHVGQNYFAALWGGGKVALHPGADDNASGSAALLEVAQALAGSEPKEDILLLWFTGEELGLLGSRAYCEQPIHAHEETIAMLNMDQIARTNPSTMNVGGLWDKPEWAKLFKRAHKRIKNPMTLDIKYGRDLFARSDQYSFHQKQVDAFFFFEGDIDDNLVYHKPGDVPETIDSEKAKWIARDYLALAWALAFEGVRP